MDRGLFSDNGQILGNQESRGVSLGDLDGDGDLDAFVSNYQQTNMVWLNSGSAQFTPGNSLSNTNDSWHSAIGDINNDGCLEVIEANENQSFAVLLNQVPALLLLGTNQSVITNNATPSVEQGNNFGNVNQGEPATHTFTITNYGSANLIIHSITTNGTEASHYSIDATPTLIEVGTVSNLTISYDATNPGKSICPDHHHEQQHKLTLYAEPECRVPATACHKYHPHIRSCKRSYF